MVKKTVALLSGGADSAVTAAQMTADNKDKNRYGVFVDYGQKSAARELVAARQIARDYGLYLEETEVRIPCLDEHDLCDGDVITFSNELAGPLNATRINQRVADRSHVIPYRNLLMISLASLFAGTVQASELWVGFDYRPKLGTATADKSPLFVRQVTSALRTAAERVPVRLVTPLQGMTKTEIIQRGHDLGVRWGHTWSCYNAFARPCGVCAQCLTRQKAFAEAKLVDGWGYTPIETVREALK